MGKNTQGFQNIKDKNYRGLLNQTKSNIPKEKENESKKEIEVITIKDDYEPEDFYCKLLCCIQKEKTVKTENVKNHAKINENQVKPFDEHFQFNNQNDKNVLCNKRPKIFEGSKKEESNENQVKPFDEHLQYIDQNDKKQKDNIEIIRDASEFPIELVKNVKDDLHFFTYKCKPCDKPFQKMYYATDHFNERHVCSYCHKLFHKTTVLQDHVKKDHQNSNVDVSNSQAGSSNVINEKNMLDKKSTQGFQNIKDKNYRGLLNQTKSNIPKEKENESKKEIEVITIEDDSDESLIKYQV